MNRIMKTCRLIFISALSVLCACITAVSGCLFLSFDGIGAVRSRAEKLRYEMSETIMDAFKNKDRSEERRVGKECYS